MAMPGSSTRNVYDTINMGSLNYLKEIESLPQTLMFYSSISFQSNVVDLRYFKL